MIETNSACNLDCRFCNRSELVAKGWREPKILALEEFQKSLAVFKDCPLDTIKIEGISEPFLHPQFDLMAAEVRNCFPNAFVIISTNLIYNLQKTAFLKTLEYVDMVYLSADGVGEKFEWSREGADWGKFIKSLDDICQNVSPEVRRKKLHLNFTCTEHNYQCLPELYKIKEERDLASVRINLAQNWSEDQENGHHFEEELLELLSAHGEDVKGVPSWQYSECFWPFQGLVVDVFGNMRQCIINTSQQPLGNIFTDDPRKIYNESQHYREVRKQLKNGCAAKSCRNCDYKHLGDYLVKILGERGEKNHPRIFDNRTEDE